MNYCMKTDLFHPSTTIANEESRRTSRSVYPKVGSRAHRAPMATHATKLSLAASHGTNQISQFPDRPITGGDRQETRHGNNQRKAQRSIARWGNRHQDGQPERSFGRPIGQSYTFIVNCNIETSTSNQERPIGRRSATLSERNHEPLPGTITGMPDAETTDWTTEPSGGQRRRQPEGAPISRATHRPKQ